MQRSNLKQLHAHIFIKVDLGDISKTNTHESMQCETHLNWNKLDTGQPTWYWAQNR